MQSTALLSAMPEISSEELTLIDRYWRAANYLSVGQIYLLDNPLLTLRRFRLQQWFDSAPENGARILLVE